MLEIIYDHLSSMNIESYKDLKNKIMKLSNKECRTLINFLFDNIPNCTCSFNSFFNFYSNSSLSGIDTECNCINCKLKNARNLALFSAMYADTVVIPSPIDKHYYSKDINKFMLIDDIAVLLFLEPLIRENIIGIFTSHEYLCAEHLKLAKKQDEKLWKSIDSLDIELEEIIKNNINYSVSSFKKSFCVSINHPNLLPKEYPISFKNIPNDLIPFISKEIGTTIPFDICKKNQLVDYIKQPIINDYIIYSFLSRYYKTTFLTNKPLEALILEKTRTNDKLSFNNELLKNINHTIPILNNVSLETILNLRKSDGESFKSYRDTINKTLKDFKFQTENDIQYFLKDVIYPEINKINLTLKNNKRKLVKSIADDILITGLSLSIGGFLRI